MIFIDSPEREIFSFSVKIRAERFLEKNHDGIPAFSACCCRVKREEPIQAMFDYLKIVEKRIKEAQENGEFDNLPGRGEPLELSDDSHIPEDLRLAYKILKNANCLPPELEEKKEIRQMEDLLADIPDEKERYKLIKKINYKIMKLNMTRNTSPLLEEKQIYYKKLLNKLDRK